jgi:uncharacterized protein
MEELKIIRHHLSQLKMKYPIDTLGVFGSVSRGEQTMHSDIDVIVFFSQPVGIEFIDLAFDLEKILDRKVDLVSGKAIKPHYFEAIKNEIIYA